MKTDDLVMKLLQRGEEYPPLLPVVGFTIDRNDLVVVTRIQEVDGIAPTQTEVDLLKTQIASAFTLPPDQWRWEQERDAPYRSHHLYGYNSLLGVSSHEVKG